MKIASLSAFVAAGLLAGGLAVSSANAADLGGNCCADLEERIAELEATTARKGNRKVSLTISGWVAEQVTWFDDGEESNVYVSGIGRTLQSHVKFTGQATISPGWSAGYVLHLELGTVDPFTMNAASDEGAPELADLGVRDTENGVYTLQSYWFLKSDHLGKVSIGKQSQASDNTAILVDGSGSLVPANWVLFDGSAFALNSNVGVLGSWGTIANCASINAGIGADCNGITENVVRYDSPTFGGFSFSASWGEDDMWDVAARYAGEFGGFKLAAAAAYSQITDENLAIPGLNGVVVEGPGDKDVGYFQVGAYVQHVATGLFLYGAYGQENIDGLYGDIIEAVGGDDNPDHWYIKAGIRQRWTPLGHTVLYGEYAEHNNQVNTGALGTGAPIQQQLLALCGFIDCDVEMQRWGVGVVQEIDAAAMSIWLSYRHHEADIGIAPGVSIDDVDIVKFGALINF